MSDAFIRAEGRRAARAGQPMTDNPYWITRHRNLWEKGWCDYRYRWANRVDALLLPLAVLAIPLGIILGVLFHAAL